MRSYYDLILDAIAEICEYLRRYECNCRNFRTDKIYRTFKAKCKMICKMILEILLFRVLKISLKITKYFVIKLFGIKV